MEQVSLLVQPYKNNANCHLPNVEGSSLALRGPLCLPREVLSVGQMRGIVDPGKCQDILSSLLQDS